MRAWLLEKYKCVAQNCVPYVQRLNAIDKDDQIVVSEASALLYVVCLG
jgi:hypothetical protein